MATINRPTTKTVISTTQWGIPITDQVNANTDAVAKLAPDIREYWKILSAFNYPGPNLPVYFDTRRDNVSSTDKSGLSRSGNNFTVNIAGLWSVSYYLQWNTNATSTIWAAWIQTVSNSERYVSSQVGSSPTISPTNNGSTMLRLAAGAGIGIYVYSSQAIGQMIGGSLDMVLIRKD